LTPQNPMRRTTRQLWYHAVFLNFTAC
jgi:hypothetical protein